MRARSLLFQGALYVTFLVEGVLFSPVLLLPERCFWPIGRFWVASCLWLHRTICLVDDDIAGRANIPPGGLLVASKHQSAWETLRLMQLFERPCFILKRELLWVPLFGWYLSKAGMIPVARGRGSDAIDAMLARSRRAIAEGRQIIIFPEGTRRPPGAEPAYRRGATRLYEALGAPCLPIALTSGLHWPRRSPIHVPGTILVEMLPPIPPGLPPEEFSMRLQAEIEAATTRLLAADAESISRGDLAS